MGAPLFVLKDRNGFRSRLFLITERNLHIPTFTFFVHFYSYVLTKKYGDVPPGLYIKSIVKDSLIYFVEAGVCFEESEDYKYPAGDTLTRIPMNVLFPEARSDTVKADFLTTYLELIGPEGSLDVLLIVKKGKIGLYDKKVPENRYLSVYMTFGYLKSLAAL